LQRTATQLLRYVKWKEHILFVLQGALVDRAGGRPAEGRGEKRSTRLGTIQVTPAQSQETSASQAVLSSLGLESYDEEHLILSPKSYGRLVQSQVLGYGYLMVL
jgi:hypothetical protein